MSDLTRPTGLEPTSHPPSGPDPALTPAPRGTAPVAPARPSLAWIAVAVAFVVAASSFVTWRALSGRENRQADATFIGAASSVMGFDYNRPPNTIWLAISGPRASRVNGDRFGAACANELLASPDGLRPACDPTNAEFDERGHLFAVRVLKAESQRPLVISVIDPQLSTGGSNSSPGCRASGVSSTPSICPGDIAGDDPSMTTTFIVRAPDTTPANPTDNPAICASTFTDQGPPAPSRTGDHWIKICTIPASRVVGGDYIVQVRTNANLSAPLTSKAAELEPGSGAGSLERAEPTARGDGQNHFGLRGEWEGGPDEGRSSGLMVNALNNAAVFMNQPNPRVGMQLMNLTSTAAGRTLRVQVFDLGDTPVGITTRSTGPASPQRSEPSPTKSGISVHFVPPQDGTVHDTPMREFPGCSFSFGDEPTGVLTPVSRCAVDGEAPERFNGRVVTVDIPIPNGFACERSLSSCWMSVQITYPGNPSDTSTWSAELLPLGTPTPSSPVTGMNLGMASLSAPRT